MRLHKNYETMSNMLMVVSSVRNSFIATQIFRKYIITIQSHDLLVYINILEF